MLPSATASAAPQCAVLAMFLCAAPFSLAAAGTMRQEGPLWAQQGASRGRELCRPSASIRRWHVAFAPGLVANLSARGRIWPLLRGGGGFAAGTQQCSWCCKVHQASAQCKAERVATARAAAGRKTGDGWRLLTTMRERSDRVGSPKGISEYGWGSTGYAPSQQGAPVKGCDGVFTVLGIETSCDDTAAAVVRRRAAAPPAARRAQPAQPAPPDARRPP
jgi:hypothetical protein